MTVARRRIASMAPRRARVPVHRRSAAEQRVIRMIRGERIEDDGGSAIYVAQFGKLRTLATRSALLIQDPGVPFLSVNELNLLAWLAQAQRVASYTRQFHPDPMLTMTIVHCAGTLDAMGIRLSSLAIYNPCVRSAYG